jgi:uncharacterized membrane protein YqjE
MRGAADEGSPEGARSGAGNGHRPLDVSRLSTAALVSRIAQDAQGLVKAEIQLARAELRADLNRLLASARRAGVAAGFLVAALLVLVAAAVLALATLMAAWLAALIVAGGLLACGGVAAALARSAKPAAALERTRRNLKDLKEDLPWKTKRA